jgi:hypothetical protein
MSPCQGLVGGPIPPSRTNRQALKVNTFRAFAVGSGLGESEDGAGISEDGAGIQDERKRGLGGVETVWETVSKGGSS